MLTTEIYNYIEENQDTDRSSIRIDR